LEEKIPLPVNMVLGPVEIESTVDAIFYECDHDGDEKVSYDEIQRVAAMAGFTEDALTQSFVDFPESIPALLSMLTDDAMVQGLLEA